MITNKIKPMVYSSKQKTEILASGTCFGFKFYVISYGTHPCSYVVIPENHKLYKKSYFDDDFDLMAHGGITYSQMDIKGLEKNNWVIGWDYAHYNDFNGLFENSISMANKDAHKWTIEELLEEVTSVCLQLKNME